MGEPSDTADEFEIRRILNAANAMQRDPRTSAELRKKLHWLIELLVADCSEADQRGIGWMVTAVAQTAFAIGAIAGTPAMVTHLQDGRRVAGGVESGKTRRAKAEGWREHAGELMRDIRSKNPGWAREKVAIEALAGWRLQNVEPPTSSRSLVELLKQLEVSGLVSKRKTETS